MTTRRWVDWVNIILGVWLIASPWLLTAIAGQGPAAWGLWSAGAATVALALLAMHKPAAWGDAIGILLGMCLIASPWLLGFSSVSTAVTNAVIIGSLVIGYALWALRIDITSSDVPVRDAYRTRPV